MQSRAEELKNFIEKYAENLKTVTKKIDECNKEHSAILDSCRKQGKGFFGAYKEQETALDEIRKKIAYLEQRKRAFRLALDAAENSYAALIADSLEAVFTSGGLGAVPVHYKKFKETVRDILSEYETEKIRVYYFTRYCSLNIAVCIGNDSTEEYVASIEGNYVSVNPDHVARTIYEASDIVRKVGQYIKLENIMLKQAEAFEKRAKEIRENFPYLESRHINKPHIIWGKQFLD